MTQIPLKHKNKIFNLLNTSCTQNLESTNKRVRTEALREVVLASNCNHTPAVFLKKSINKTITPIIILRGQYFTNYRQLADKWNCTIKQARLQIQKWLKNETIKTQRVYDKKNFDIGLLITYNWLFNEENWQSKKKGNRETINKSEFNKKKGLVNIKKGNHKEKILKIKLHKKEMETEEVSFSFSKDLNFGLIAKQLNEIGLSDYRIDKFYKQYSKEDLEKYLELLNLNKSKIKNYCAWLITALNQKFDLSQVHNWKEKQNERQRLDEEIQRQAKLKQELEIQKEIQKIKDEQKINHWISKTSDQQQNQLILEEFETLKQKNKFIHSYLLKRFKSSEEKNLLDFLRKDTVMQTTFKSRILEIVAEESQKPSLNNQDSYDHSNSYFEIKTNKLTPALPRTLRSAFSLETQRA